MGLWPGWPWFLAWERPPLGFLLDKMQVTVQEPEFANSCALVRAPAGSAAAGLWTLTTAKHRP